MMSEQIQIQVYLHTTLVRFSPDGKTRKFNLYLPEDSTIRDLVEQLGIVSFRFGMERFAGCHVGE